MRITEDGWELVGEDGTIVALTPTERQLLLCLLHHANQYVSKDSLIQHVWGASRANLNLSRALWTHMSRLRRKLETDPSPRLDTHNRRGYRLTAPVEIATPAWWKGPWRDITL